MLIYIFGEELFVLALATVIATLFAMALIVKITEPVSPPIPPNRGRDLNTGRTIAVASFPSGQHKATRAQKTNFMYNSFASQNVKFCSTYPNAKANGYAPGMCVENAKYTFDCLNLPPPTKKTWMEEHEKYTAELEANVKLFTDRMGDEQRDFEAKARQVERNVAERKQKDIGAYKNKISSFEVQKKELARQLEELQSSNSEQQDTSKDTNRNIRILEDVAVRITNRVEHDRVYLPKIYEKQLVVIRQSIEDSERQLK
ncbi:hypothetical protein BJ742DRAFT_771873 [Cladochytrium replicatum]|nr:hypothetical protein BJ742DRAFT_771873 [Cladochytrium replicatum]